MSHAGAEVRHVDELRCFGRALVQDERRPQCEAAAAQLTEHLVRKTLVGDVDVKRRRADLFARFVAFHREYVRKSWTQESDLSWPENVGGGAAQKLRSALQALELEQREVILLVALSGFPHSEAAEVLGISLVQFISRLDKARAALTALLDEDEGAETFGSARKAPHIRIVK